jgi:hypothetical protein
MRHEFHCCGHENIRAKHHKTIEFTKDTDLTLRGDCIIGLGADYDLATVKRLEGQVRITVEVGGLQDRFRAIINPGFDDDREMVFRRSTFRSKRTLGIRLNKGAISLNRDIVQLMRDPTARMKVTLESAEGTTRLDEPGGRAGGGANEADHEHSQH